MNLVCNILSTFPHIFVLLDFPFNTAIYILFRYETRRLFFPYLLFLCLFSHHQFHSHTHSTAPFYIWSGQLQFSFPYICSPSFQTATCCSAIRCIAYPLGSVFCLIFFFLMWHLYWVATRICASSCWLSQTIIIFSASFCGWHSITRSHGWNCYDMRTIPILFSSSTASSLLTH